jgi:zinc/manganese transport system permease protein
MNWSALDWGILGPALMAGLLVLATHVPLGMQVLARGIVFIDLAIAQIAGLGVIAADAFGLPDGGVAVQLAAVCAALLGALLLTWTERRAPQQQEALIGVMFILAACAGIMLLAGNPHGGEHLKDLLVGQILWVNTTQLLWLTAVTVPLLAALRLGWIDRLGRFGFYAAFALAVTASVQVVGVYLVFSSLIIPALGTLNQRGPRRYAWAYGLGASGFALGLALSALLDLPSGAVIVWALAACAVGLVIATRAAGAARESRRASELVLGLRAQGGSGRTVVQAEQNPGVVLDRLPATQTQAPEPRRTGDV